MEEAIDGFIEVFGGLPAGGNLEAYVATLCDNGDTSLYFGPVAFVTPPRCGDLFYDTGGPDGNYASSDFMSMAICPDPGQIVSITFDSFDLGPCCSTMDIFTSANSWTLMGTDNPGTISATAPDECINLFFNANGQSAPGWEAIVSCNTCPGPFNLFANQIGSTSASINWSFLPNASFYYYEIGPPGFEPGTGQQFAGASIVNNTIVIPGLASNTDYEFAVRAHCGSTDTSEFSAILPFRTSPSCGDRFYDPGGPDEGYHPFQTVTSIICPEQTGTFISVEFDSFSIWAGSRLEVMDGEGFGNFIGFWSGQDNPGTINANNSTGCLTFTFVPNGNSFGFGWDANISCITCPSPNAVSINTSQGDVNLSWNFIPSASYIVEIGPDGFTPGTSAAIINEQTFQTFFSTTILDGAEEYDVYIKSICSAGDTSHFVGPFSFTTPPSCGDSFFDPGGPDEDYPLFSFSETLICPSGPDEFAELVFSEFDIDPCCNTFSVLDGLNFLQVPLDEGIPEPIVGAFPGMCITVFFESFNNHNPGTGWAAEINCPTCPPPKNAIINKVTSTSVEFSWLNVFIDQTVLWEIGLPGFVPGANDAFITGTTPGFNSSVEASGLMGNTTYELYLKNQCMSDTSVVY